MIQLKGTKCRVSGTFDENLALCLGEIGIYKKQMEMVPEAKEMLEAILRTIDEGIHVVNQDGITIFYNHVAAKHDGLQVDEVVNRHLFDAFPSLDKESSTLLKVIETGQPIINQQQQYTNKNGQQVITVNTTLPIYVEDKLVGAVEIAKDISKLKNLSEKLMDLQARLQSSTSKKELKYQQATYHFQDIITGNDRLKRMIHLAKKAAVTNSPVLIHGETGTGKELFVQAIHNFSPRKEKPFIAQNCAALPASLLEGILFGTVKGSFTGAENRPGLFELAHNGTLFLDEINSMPIELQAKLLRVLQDGMVRRIGDSVSRQVNVRIIAATNIDPLLAVEKGLIRSDLYYRINVVSFTLPPLRERKGDIPLLTNYFITKYNERFQKYIEGVSKQVEKLFFRYHWPGNIRELEHSIEYAMNMMDGKRIEVYHLPSHFQSLSETTEKESLNQQLFQEVEQINFPLLEEKGLKETMEIWEKYWIKEALNQENGNIQKAAKRLKIPRQTLQYKINKYFTK